MACCTATNLAVDRIFFFPQPLPPLLSEPPSPTTCTHRQYGFDMQVIHVTRFQALYLAAPKEGREAIRNWVLDSPGGGLVAFSPRGVETQPQNAPPSSPLAHRHPGY